MIQRYDLCGWVWPSMSMLSSIVLSPVKDGRYVLYTDHIAETRKLIDTYDLLISQEDKKIAELEAENKRLSDLLWGAGERGEKLDFDCVRPEEEYKIKNLVLSRESQKKIRRKIEEWKKNAHK